MTLIPRSKEKKEILAGYLGSDSWDLTPGLDMSDRHYVGNFIGDNV